MKIYWKISFLFLWAAAGLAQDSSDFKGIISLDENEPNMAGQVFEYQSNLYLSGDYFDSNINRWTAYFAKLKESGEIDFIKMEKVDTVVGIRASNKVHSLGDSLFVGGSGNGNRSLLAFDLTNETIMVAKKIHYTNVNMAISDFEIKSSTEDVILAGRNTEDFNENEVKIINYGGEDIYLGPGIGFSNLAHHIKTLDDGRIVALCSEQFVLNGKISFYQYLIFLDQEMNLLKTTRTDQIELQPLTGFLIDSENNIISSGILRQEEEGEDVFLSMVVKYNSDGDTLWFKSMDYNVKNDFGLGNWSSIVETAEKDGYILVGTETKNYSNQRDSLISEPSIIRIDLEGNVLWKRNYPFRTTVAGVQESFNDIILTSDDNYFIGGGSTDFAIEHSNPWIESIYIKIDGNGELVSTSSSENLPMIEQHLTVFPNPSNDMVDVQIPLHLNDGRLIVTDEKGHLIFTRVINSNENNFQFDFSDFPAGIYFFKHFTDDDLASGFTSKVVIN